MEYILSRLGCSRIEHAVLTRPRAIPTFCYAIYILVIVIKKIIGRKSRKGGSTLQQGDYITIMLSWLSLVLYNIFGFQC